MYRSLVPITPGPESVQRFKFILYFAQPWFQLAEKSFSFTYTGCLHDSFEFDSGRTTQPIFTEKKFVLKLII